MPSIADSITSAAMLLMLGITAASNSQAASVSYVLDQSSSMPDGIGYLQVTISDGLHGAIDFTVRMLEPLTAVAGKRFGIQKFSFNVAPGDAARAVNVTGLPAGWRAGNGGRLDGFGKFDISLKGNGAHRLNALTFSITGINSDVPLDYVSLSTGYVKNGTAFFAGNVHGLAVARSASQATFGSGASAVPAPAALWLFAAGLGLLTRWTRRRSTGASLPSM